MTRLELLEETKRQCITMWEHLAEHITDRKWRKDANKARHDRQNQDNFGRPYSRDSPGLFKRHAISIVTLGSRPTCGCYLCEVLNTGCHICPLGGAGRYSSSGCDSFGTPFSSFRRNVIKRRWSRARGTSR